MKVKFIFKTREDCMIGLMFINDFKSMKVIDQTEKTITAEITKIDLSEATIIKFFAQPINVEVID